MYYFNQKRIITSFYLAGEHSHSEVRAHDSHGHKHNKSHNSHKYNQQHNSNHNNNNHNYNTYSTHSSHNSHNSHNYNNNNHQHQRHGSQSYLSPDTPSVTYHHGSQNYQSFSPSLPPLSPSLPPSIPAGGILYTDPSAPLYSPSPAEPLLQQENSPRIDILSFLLSFHFSSFLFSSLSFLFSFFSSFPFCFLFSCHPLPFSYWLLTTFMLSLYCQ